jgi:transposase-like protein
VEVNKGRCIKDARKRLATINTSKKKDFALFLYLNNNGIRQLMRILKVSPLLVLCWIKKVREDLKELKKR